MSDVTDLIDDVASALSGARRELLVVSEASHDLSIRISRRAEELDELRAHAGRVEELQEELQAATARATDSADLAVERIRHERQQLKSLDEHPARAEQHLRAAQEFLERVANSPDLDDENRQRISALRAQTVLIHDAVDLTTGTLARGQAELERTETVLRPLVDDLQAGGVTGTARLPLQATEHLGIARSQVRQASLTSEHAGQNALTAARVVSESRARLERARSTPPGAPCRDRSGRPPGR